MSYILDALRRAEADRERERGQVPGLHTQALSGSDTARAIGPRRWLPWAGGSLLLIAGIGAGSWWAGSPQEAPAPVAAPQPAPVAVPVPAPTPQQLASAPTPQPAASASPYLPAVPPPVAVAPAPAPVPAPRPNPVAVPAPTPAPVAATPVPAPQPAPVQAPAPAPVAEAPIPKLTELPENIRRDVPRFVVSGSVYSEDPRGRFAMINGEVMREGALIGPDHVLEQIRPRELVLRFRGVRYRQPV